MGVQVNKQQTLVPKHTKCEGKALRLSKGSLIDTQTHVYTVALCMFAYKLSQRERAPAALSLPLKAILLTMVMA